MTIHIGLTGWGDHETLYHKKVASKDKLAIYSSHFPVVEVDTAFYAIQSQKNYENWVKETPDNFSFVIKAFQRMTGHDKYKMSLAEAKELFKSYRESIQPVIEAGKLNAVLFQFPPWFDVNNDNVKKLRIIRDLLPDLPLALEFRNQSWFKPAYKESTLEFMEEGRWIHSICDEPQAGEGSIPTVLKPTNSTKTLIRFHGRNVHGWNKNGRSDWRKVRFLYRYNAEELAKWAQHISELCTQTEEVTVLFNNNSGGDAADNAKQLIGTLGITYENLNPRQMDLFQF